MVLAAAARFVPRIVVTAGSAGICGVVVLLAMAALVVGPDMSALEVPIGPMGTVMPFGLDALAASFLLLLFLVMPCADTAPLPLAAMAVTVLAGNGFALAVGLLLLGGIASLRPAAFAVVCLTVALALAGPSTDFAVMRAAPPDGWRAATVLLLVLAGAGAVSRVNAVVATYLVLRVLFDLCGVGQPLWWGVPLLLAGAGIAVIGSLRGALAETLHEVLSLCSLNQFGMVAMGLGVAQFARADDLPSVASNALAAAWLALVCHVLCRTLLLRCATAVESGAGTRRLDRLGGLLHHMPITAGCCLLGLFTIAALPPGLGFAAFWLLFQSLLVAARVGDLGVQLLIVGRPRTPRAAAPEEAPRPVQLVLGGLAASTGVLGLLPALALVPAVGWTHAAASGQWLALRAGAEAPGYSPLAVAVLVTLAVFVVLRVLRRPGEARREPAWSGGFAAPPPWLPFGDPATQFGPASFIEPLRRLLALLPSAVAMRNRLVRWRDSLLRVAATLVTR